VTNQRSCSRKLHGIRVFALSNAVLITLAHLFWQEIRWALQVWDEILISGALLPNAGRVLSQSPAATESISWKGGENAK
jgi:hypothetical protein